MAAGGGSPSIVEFFGGEDGYRCGYCRSDTGNLSHGAGGAGWERGRPGLAEKRRLRARGRGGRPGQAAARQQCPAAQPETRNGSYGPVLPNECDRTEQRFCVVFLVYFWGVGGAQGNLALVRSEKYGQLHPKVCGGLRVFIFNVVIEISNYHI